MLIDDLSIAHPLASNGARWQLFTDQVMGGISQGTAVREIIAGRAAIRLRGNVSLENNGGFVQIGLDLAPDGACVDASLFDGVELDVRGNGDYYGVHLRTDAVTRPWQSYRQTFVTTEEWQTVRLPFVRFEPHRIASPLDTQHLRRIGIVAIGRAFTADVALARLAFYRRA
ncbi:MAG: CIA30 family protein [Burkholderiales bacterium]|nr:CIA30 family protein [Burkholderiales bacterium]